MYSAENGDILAIQGGGETSLVLDRTFEAVRSNKSVFYRIGSDDGARVGGRPGTEGRAS